MVEADYLEESKRVFGRQKGLAERALVQLTDEDVFRTIDPESNSIAIIVRHMAGNMRSRWTDLLTSDGEKPWRNRDSEFVIDAGTTREQVMDWWEQGWGVVFATLGSLRPEHIGATVTFAENRTRVLQAIQRQIDHYGYHAGQIVFLTKNLRWREWRHLSVARGESAAAGKYLKP